MGGHTDSRKFYDTMRRDYYRYLMSVDAITTVRDYQSYVKTGAILMRHQKHLRPFPPVGTLELVVMYLLVLF